MLQGNILQITKYEMLDERKLMDIYAESNLLNTEWKCPEELDKNLAVQNVEEGFLKFLREDFFNHDEATYWVLEKGESWVCALRTCKIECGSYYLEALETIPEERKKGYAVELIKSVIASLKQKGALHLYDCINKKNTASLNTHKKCGFQIIAEDAYDYLSKTTNPRCYGLEYRF